VSPPLDKVTVLQIEQINARLVREIEERRAAEPARPQRQMELMGVR